MLTKVIEIKICSPMQFFHISFRRYNMEQKSYENIYYKDGKWMYYITRADQKSSIEETISYYRVIATFAESSFATYHITRFKYSLMGQEKTKDGDQKRDRKRLKRRANEINDGSKKLKEEAKDGSKDESKEIKEEAKDGSKDGSKKLKGGSKEDSIVL